MYNNELTIEEKRDIQKFIQSLPKETDDSHPIAFENNGYIYTFNTKLDLYEENRRDGDGFEILHKFDLNSLTNEQKNILRKVGYRDTRTYDQNIDEFRSWRDNYKSSDVASTGITTTVEIDGVDGEPKRDQRTDRRGNTGAGNENRRGNEEVTPQELQRGSLSLESDKPAFKAATEKTCRRWRRRASRW